MPALIPFLVMCMGALIFAVSSPPDPPNTYPFRSVLRELGRIAFAAGLLVTLWHSGGPPL